VIIKQSSPSCIVLFNNPTRKEDTPNDAEKKMIQKRKENQEKRK